MAETIPDIEKLVEEAKQHFKGNFQDDANVTVCAPGRVNLIGDHTDYNDGFVMPMALPLVTVMAGRIIDGELSTIITLTPDPGDDNKTTIDMPNRNALLRAMIPGPPKWSNYVKGVVANYIGDIPPAFNAVIISSVPMNSGLSSSAALEVAIYTFLDAITGPNNVLSSDKALACQKAEHKYVNVPCGIMDQFISLMGKKDNAILIDCRYLTVKEIPIVDPNIVILITNTNIKHDLSTNLYAIRRQQCEQAALLLKKLRLRDATLTDIEYLKSINTDPVIVKRAYHVVTENQRVLEASEALKQRDYKKFGKLMIESHTSLKTDFEVSCRELDQLVNLALQMEGVYGSRMTGGGFGGCTVTMVEQNTVNRVISYIQKSYRGKATCYVVKPCIGAQIIDNPKF